jgi:serine/threonine protein phosphatase PrpC
MSVNGDAYLVKEWERQTLLAVIDGLGHGEEASVASEKAREYVAENFADDVDQIVEDLHVHLHGTRGAVVGLLKIDGAKKRVAYCGIGNTEVRIDGEPPMHPCSLSGVLGKSLRKATKFEYRCDLLRAVVLHSDGISGQFDLSNYSSIHKNPQEAAEQILAEWGNKDDDATIIIAVEGTQSVELSGASDRGLK